MNRGRVVRFVAVLLGMAVGLVFIANLAVFWHGALFIALVPVYAWFGNSALNWALRD